PPKKQKTKNKKQKTKNKKLLSCQLRVIFSRSEPSLTLLLRSRLHPLLAVLSAALPSVRRQGLRIPLPHDRSCPPAPIIAIFHLPMTLHLSHAASESAENVCTSSALHTASSFKVTTLQSLALNTQKANRPAKQQNPSTSSNTGFNTELP